MQTEEEIFGRGSLNIEKEEELYALCANGEEPGRKEPA
jgi:hypothetical protein